ncbi:MAG: hypothetical protein EBZ62_00400 [Sphingobacteriia bacterium]|nr:hypothetical protein [Sphingobacteriia bacterium]
MHEPYDDDYYEDNYDDSYEYDQDKPNLDKFYFKFYVSSNPLSDWLKNTIDDLIFKNNIINNTPVPLPMTGFVPSYKGASNTPLYVGNNQYNEPVWKNKYFIHDKIDTEYKNYIKNNAVHFIQQPNYYKGMFDILN